jgi:hypothetical protein
MAPDVVILRSGVLTTVDSFGRLALAQARPFLLADVWKAVRSGMDSF